MNILRTFIGVFARHVCVCCDVEINQKSAICNSCFAHIEPINQNLSCKKCGRNCENDICFFCAKSMPKFTQAKAYCNYNDVSASIIKNYKYHNNSLCKAFIASKVKEIYNQTFVNEKIDFIIPVPMNFFKEWLKGYNHTAQIAKLAFEKHKLLPFALKKKFIFKKQVESSRKERLQNMKGIFYLNSNINIAGKNILLFDDTITTGATIFECTKVLLENNAKNVFVLTFAKSIADEEFLKNLQEETL